MPNPAFSICHKKGEDRRRRTAARNRATDHCLCFSYMNNTILLLPNSEIASFYPSPLDVYNPVCVGPDRRIPKTGFLVMQLIYLNPCLNMAMTNTSHEYRNQHGKNKCGGVPGSPGRSAYDIWPTQIVAAVTLSAIKCQNFNTPPPQK